MIEYADYVEAVPMSAFLTQIKEVYDEARSLLEKKNRDYSVVCSPFHNLQICEKIGVADTETGMLVRMLDKFGRISTLLKQNSAPAVNESIEDTLIDLMNYCALLIVYRKQGQKHGD